VRHQHALKVGTASAHFGKLRVGQGYVIAMRQMIDQRRTAASWSPSESCST
jgi:hypothetical protein